MKRHVKTLLALDPGYHMGWAYFEDDQLISSGVHHFKGERHTRFIEMEETLSHIMKRKNPQRIAYEHVRRWMSSDAALAYNGALAIILMASEGIPMVGFAPTSIKKHATGSGKATKEDMIKAANELYDITVEDDNEADAVLVGRLALAT